MPQTDAENQGGEYAASVFKEFNIYALILGKTKSFQFRRDRNHQIIKVLSTDWQEGKEEC